jgi:hypothetical protein
MGWLPAMQYLSEFLVKEKNFTETNVRIGNSFFPSAFVKMIVSVV